MHLLDQPSILEAGWWFIFIHRCTHCYI